ncbi:MAG: hypothetical protein U1F81_19725 [Verrucomicrobiaceae bacterium]
MTALRNTLIAASALLLAAFVAPASAQQGYYAAGHYTAPQAQAAYAQQQAAAYAQNQAAWAACYRQQQANAQAWAAYHAQQAAAAAAARSAPRATPVAAPRAAAPAIGNSSSQIRFDGRFASVGASAPAQLQHAVYAANTLQNKPYVRGGGHASVEDNAYDCSGSVSYVLIKAGLLCAPPSPPALSPPMAKPARAASSPSGSSLASMFS